MAIQQMSYRHMSRMGKRLSLMDGHSSKTMQKARPTGIQTLLK